MRWIFAAKSSAANCSAEAELGCVNVRRPVKPADDGHAFHGFAQCDSSPLSIVRQSGEIICKLTAVGQRSLRGMGRVEGFVMQMRSKLDGIWRKRSVT